MALRSVRETTRSGYLNRNGQEVIQRPHLPGDDHNQKVYVLHCRQCTTGYGANDSDFLQPRCRNAVEGARGGPHTDRQMECPIRQKLALQSFADTSRGGLEGEFGPKVAARQLQMPQGLMRRCGDSVVPQRNPRRDRSDADIAAVRLEEFG